MLKCQSNIEIHWINVQTIMDLSKSNINVNQCKSNWWHTHNEMLLVLKGACGIQPHNFSCTD